MPGHRALMRLRPGSTVQHSDGSIEHTQQLRFSALGPVWVAVATTSCLAEPRLIWARSKPHTPSARHRRQTRRPHHPQGHREPAKYGPSAGIAVDSHELAAVNSL